MSHSKLQRSHKPRFKDWLLYVLDNELSEDARWKDRARRTAVIRWPHKSRGTWSLEKDARLFQMWAITSGKYRVNVDEPNPKSWKCNFRMNLNICKNIVELKQERIAKGPNACRVFKFLDRRMNQLPACSWDYSGKSGYVHNPQTRAEYYPSGNFVADCAMQEPGRDFHNATIRSRLQEMDPSLSGARYMYADVDEIPPQVVDEYCNNFAHQQLNVETGLTSFQPVEQDHPLNMQRPPISSQTGLTTFEPVDRDHSLNIQHGATSSESSETSFEPVEENHGLKLPIDSYEATELKKMADSLVDPLNFPQANM